MSNTAGQKEFLAELGRFARREIEPGMLEADAARDMNWLARVWGKSRRLDLPGLFASPSPQEEGATRLLCARALEALAASCPGAACLYAFHFAAAHVLDRAGGPLAGHLQAGGNDPFRAPLVVSFPDPSRDADLRLAAAKDGYTLSGETNLLGNAHLAHSAVIFVPEGDRPDQCSCVLADLGAAGVSRGPDARLPGLCANPFSRIRFDETAVSAPCLLPPDRAEGIMQEARGLFFAFTAATAAGCAARALEKADAYARSRYQFGKNIIGHSEMKRMLAKMRMRLFLARSAVSALFSGPLFHPEEALYAKVFSTDAALATATDAVQIHGGYGYMHEYGVEKIMRDAKTLQLLGGPNPHLLAGSVKE
ncbi:MAG: acyl-CoA dehydrogenase family protein [Thermodesulfobacteriota bacterium]